MGCGSGYDWAGVVGGWDMVGSIGVGRGAIMVGRIWCGGVALRKGGAPRCRDGCVRCGEWIDSFLCFRQQRVVVNGVKSDGSGFVGCPPGHRSWSLVILSVHK